ncbi:MAG: dynamin family protein, partial [Gammaproteobacteria bacterium]|nr:dynamin family protein [Gammaproteobacteria bacterium]
MKIKPLFASNIWLINSHKIRSLLGHSDQALDTLFARIFRIATQPITLAVMGEFSAGKSTFINRLLNTGSLLPVAILPKTAAITRLIYGETPAIEVFYHNSEERSSERHAGYELLQQFQQAAKINDESTLKQISAIREIRV